MVAKKITIIGLGLMGGSLGLALRQNVAGLEVWGVDQKEEIIEEALQKGAVDYATLDLAQGVKNADIVFLATPLNVMPELCQAMLPDLKEEVLLTDLGSSKVGLVECMETILPAHVSFLGGHPLTGREKSGIKAARADLFAHTVYVLTPTVNSKPEVITQISALLNYLQVKIVLLSPEEHDRKVAAISHLPHLLANLLLNMVGALEKERAGYFLLSAGGFRDLTRLAESSSTMWTDILGQNKALLPLLQEFIQLLTQCEQTLKQQDWPSLEKRLSEANYWKKEMQKLVPQKWVF